MSSEQSVPKPIVSLEAITVANDSISTVPAGDSKPDVFGKPQIVSLPSLLLIVPPDRRQG
jgi:hypothetical protein